MGDDLRTSVVDTSCRSWDIPNLWICDGSVFPTIGGVNPGVAHAIKLLTREIDRDMAMLGIRDIGGEILCNANAM